MIRTAMTVLGSAAILAAAAGFGGALHPIGDSLAVFQLPLALAGMALLLPAPRMLFWPALVVGMLAMLNVLSSRLAPGTPGPYTVYQKNLLFNVRDPAPVVADILAQAPDVVVLQEVGEANRALLETLSPSYPVQGWCPFRRIGGVAVATRWPAMGEVVCSDAGGLAALKVRSPAGPVWLVSLHLHWPWPHGQADQVERLIPLLEGLDAPVILAGDFNMVPWGWSVGRIARATGTVLSGANAPTFFIGGWMPLPIDHVMAGGGAGEVRPLLGSDHMGVLARVAVPRR